MLVLVILINVAVFVTVFLVVITLFRTPIDTPDDAAFRVDVDNIRRNTIFEMVALRPFLYPIYQVVRRLNLPGFKRDGTR